MSYREFLFPLLVLFFNSLPSFTARIVDPFWWVNYQNVQNVKRKTQTPCCCDFLPRGCIFLLGGCTPPGRPPDLALSACYLSKMSTTFQNIKEIVSLIGRITYLQKFQTSVISTIVLSIKKLNDTQTRRLVRKCDSSRKIGMTERASEGGQLTQLQHCPSPNRWCCRKSRRGRQRR